MFAQAAVELRRALRDLLGALRTTGRDLGAEGRFILAEADAPEVAQPGLWRRAWRLFRRTPVVLQWVAGLLVFASWCWVVYEIWIG